MSEHVIKLCVLRFPQATRNKQTDLYIARGSAYLRSCLLLITVIMSQQGAALQTYNNELVKCKFLNSHFGHLVTETVNQLN